MGVFTAQQRPHQIECSKIDPNYESVFYAPENIEDTWQKSLEHCGDDQLARIDSLSKQRQVKGSRAYYFLADSVFLAISANSREYNVIEITLV